MAHPHGHLLVSDGAFQTLEVSTPLATWDAEALLRLFRERLLARLVDKHAISQELATKLMAWRHPGFSAHVGEPMSADDTQALENLAGYVTRNPLSLQRLSTICLSDGSIVSEFRTAGPGCWNGWRDWRITSRTAVTLLSGFDPK